MPILWMLALLACLAIAVIADASSPDPGKFVGQIRPSGSAELRIHYRRIDHARFRIYHWVFDGVPLHCPQGREVSRLSVDGKEKARNRFADHQPFGYTVSEGSSGHPTYATKVRGRLVTRNKARGVVRVHGSSVRLCGGGHGNCDSGRLHWTVRRWQTFGFRSSRKAGA